jgi:hypothetical protein
VSCVNYHRPHITWFDRGLAQQVRKRAKDSPCHVCGGRGLRFGEHAALVHEHRIGVRPAHVDTNS